MIMQYMNESKSNGGLQHPPPSIWNANTLLQDNERAAVRPWSLKLRTITEGNKNSLTKLPQPRAPLTYASSPESSFSGPFNTEPITLKVPTEMPGNVTSSNLLNNARSKSNVNISEENAAATIQRAYKRYKVRKRLNIRHHHFNSKSAHASAHEFQKVLPKSRKSSGASVFLPEKNVFPENSRCLAFSDYLREGSLYFPERESVLVFGGIDPHGKYGDGRNTGRNIFRYNSELNKWDLVGELPQPRHHHAVAFLKGKIFLAGGSDPRDDEKGKTIVVGTVWSFDPVARSWHKEAEMLTPRKNFGLAVMNGKLLAIGGQDKDGRILSSVERYDPSTGVWEYVASLNTERTGLAATKYSDSIWVAGGMTGSRKTPLTSSVECYDTKSNIWIEQANLRFPRCFGCLFPMNDVLYFIGGAGRASEKERTTSSCNAIDVWNSKEEVWKLHFAMSTPRHGHTVAYLGTQILIIGGVTTAYLRALTDVECFCCERKIWVKGISALPVPLSGHGAATLPPASLM